MRKWFAIAGLCVVAAGCSRADVEVLSRIASQVSQRADAVWQSEANARLLNALPRLQPSRGASSKASDPTPIDNGGVTPRLNVE